MKYGYITTPDNVDEVKKYLRTNRKIEKYLEVNRDVLIPPMLYPVYTEICKMFPSDGYVVGDVKGAKGYTDELKINVRTLAGIAKTPIEREIVDHSAFYIKTQGGYPILYYKSKTNHGRKATAGDLIRVLDFLFKNLKTDLKGFEIHRSDHDKIKAQIEAKEAAMEQRRTDWKSIVDTPRGLSASAKKTR